ncbi:arsenic resistance protein ArsH [Aspergillus saccharolyticus JOP 1030-1]|uniref:Arsenic resistance protein ArsH n=1 Tax=Aspergillus saccharolyticus JOP 1030-1 TaxID=1450539 RepID=A0A318Z0L6_9EURO|nr:arsenic resistance protein ArsH [Aspergillus saccharolyticus JOP 1030-1]PYH40449.1 arsenic resistance protein ArsH [Aspergillus saccharolyticus JOP 1030-1]
MSNDTYNLVQSRYGDIAKQTYTTQQHEKEEQIARAFGYSAEDLSSLPEKTNLGLSCGNPVGFANVKKGETILDLGSGSGIDVLLAARKVGVNGQAIGVDMTKKAGVSNAKFFEATINSVPLPDSSIDCIISNCVINLVPEIDKQAVFKEIARLLKPGGRIAISDILARKPLPDQITKNMALYTTMAHPAVAQPGPTVPDFVNGHESIQCPYPSLAIPQSEDDADIRQQYRPFILDDAAEDWVNALELTTAMNLAMQELQKSNNRLKVLVLYGSLRRRSYSRLVALEASRILLRLGCDVRVFNPEGLPVKNDTEHGHSKVQELRELSKWSDGHVWVSPEQHGNLTAVFKNQIDWIPLSTGSVRPTQGRTLAIAQVCGGSQSFNAVNSLRLLGRWMRMFTIPNQSSIPKAYTHFPDEGQPGDQRLMPSGNRDRLVDCMEEFVKYTFLIRPHLELFGDRFSEREEKRAKEEKLRLARVIQP